MSNNRRNNGITHSARDETNFGFVSTYCKLAQSLSLRELGCMDKKGGENSPGIWN